MNKWLCGFWFLMFSSVGVAMSILDVGKACVFSQVEGVITFKGEPVVGARVIRRLEDENDNAEDDFTVTDDRGYFSMPARMKRFANPLQEVFGWQYMFVEYGGEEIQIWGAVKHQKEQNSELGGVPISLVCELTNDKRIWETRDLGYRVSSICDFNNFDGINVLAKDK